MKGRCWGGGRRMGLLWGCWDWDWRGCRG